MSTSTSKVEDTKGVSVLLGDPKKAVLKLSIPMIIAMMINSLYALIDGIWVAGLGDTALAAIGFVNPIYLIVMGFPSGIGAGATAVISRYIGARDKKQADNAALHVMLLTVILTIIFTVVILLFLKPILLMFGAGSTINLGLDYGNILFLGSIFIVFSSTAYGVLRAEGNVAKTTYAMLFGAILNIILDPIFIYSLNMGVQGAAIATVISLALVSLLLLYWFKTDTYIKFSLKDFIYDNEITKQILNVGLPAGSEFLIIATLSGSLNLILIMVGGVDAVAVYTAGWRVVMIAMVPPIAIGASIVAVTGANFGANKFKNIDIIHSYGIKIGMVIVIIVAIAIFLLAPYISYLFAYSPESEGLRNVITDFLRVTSLFYLFLPIGISSTSIFQGVGKGLDSLLIVVVRNLILDVLFAYLLAVVLGFGQYGVWWGIVIGNALGSAFAYFWSKYYIRKMEKTREMEKAVIVNESNEFM
ncbi:multidrug export protein MepA [Methanobrevibacter cuticularis]|uniref:Multidrug export protein MepA n=1 Tax=Methanobrevibacter cuticularis TaxID=47311 RepID=A0A166EUF8_9EURY|nr:MATE family efflux transporter [Methanobrevibacter cuticularis]KZX17022.1 multidrug export protein MepA [Methanobrevibacter cuticularis]